MEPLQENLYPDNELASPPLAQPLRKPSFVPSVADRGEDCELFAHSTSRLSGRSAETTRRKHESYNLSGSVFLVTASGTTLNLPVPSESPLDPLNWNRWKRAGAITAVAWHSIVSLTVVQAASVVYHGISVEFDGQVCVWSLEHRTSTNSMCTGHQAVDDRDTCDSSYIVHGLWRIIMGTFVLGYGKTPNIPNCGIDDAACDDRRWLCRELPSTSCLPVLSRLGRGILIDICVQSLST